MTEIEKQLKLKKIDQLDAAVLQFSSSTLTVKKLCFTILVAVITLFVTYGKAGINIPCVSAMIIIICWFLDAYFYYYQKLLRERIENIIKELQDVSGINIHEPCRFELIFKSLFNSSHLFYLLLIIAVSITCFLWEK